MFSNGNSFSGEKAVNTEPWPGRLQKAHQDRGNM